MSASLFENKPESCPFGHQLWPGKAQVSWTPCICEPAREAAGRGHGMGHVRVACNSCHCQAAADGVLRTAARQRAPAAHRLGDGTGSSALSAPARTAKATATAEGRSAAATQTTQMISSAVCALRMLAFMPARRPPPAGECRCGCHRTGNRPRPRGVAEHLLPLCK